jgi:uncharacterized membrane protein
MGDQLPTVTLFAATLAAGLSAGLFFTWANAVMPGLRRAFESRWVRWNLVRTVSAVAAFACLTWAAAATST